MSHFSRILIWEWETLDKSERDKNLEAIDRIKPVHRRKFLATLLGVSVGGVASLYAPQSQAFGFLSPTELFKKFLEKAGGVLMMFICNRFYKNFIEGFDKYTDIQKESKKKEYGLIGGTFQNSVDYQMNQEREIHDNEFKRRTETSPRICADTQQGGLIAQTTRATTVNTHNIASGQSKIFFESDFKEVDGYRSAYKTLVDSVRKGDGTLSVENLSMIYGTEGFKDISAAQNELTLLLADIVRAPNHAVFGWRDGVKFTLAKNTQSLKREALRGISTAVQANLILEPIAYAMARRVPSRSLTEIMSQTLLGATANQVKQRLEDGGPFICAVEALQLEIESKALEPGFLEEMNNYSDPTPLMYYMNNQQSLLNKIKLERSKIQELRNSLQAVHGILKVELNS